MVANRPSVFDSQGLVSHDELAEDDTLYREEWTNSDALRAMTNRLMLPRPRVVAKRAGSGTRSGAQWCVTLTLADDALQQKVFIVEDNAVLGAYPPDDSRVDISLEDWDARSRGVSRCHAAIRSGPSRLLLIDLGSTNGTYLNSVPVGRGWAHTLSDGDLITLGALNLWVHITEQPAS